MEEWSLSKLKRWIEASLVKCNVCGGCRDDMSLWGRETEALSHREEKREKKETCI